MFIVLGLFWLGARWIVLHSLLRRVWSYFNPHLISLLIFLVYSFLCFTDYRIFEGIYLDGTNVEIWLGLRFAIWMWISILIFSLIKKIIRYPKKEQIKEKLLIIGGILCIWIEYQEPKKYKSENPQHFASVFWVDSRQTGIQKERGGNTFIHTSSSKDILSYLSFLLDQPVTKLGDPDFLSLEVFFQHIAHQISRSYGVSTKFIFFDETRLEEWHLSSEGNESKKMQYRPATVGEKFLLSVTPHVWRGEWYEDKMRLSDLSQEGYLRVLLSSIRKSYKTADIVIINLKIREETYPIWQERLQFFAEKTTKKQLEWMKWSHIPHDLPFQTYYLEEASPISYLYKIQKQSENNHALLGMTFFDLTKGEGHIYCISNYEEGGVQVNDFKFALDGQRFPQWERRKLKSTPNIWVIRSQEECEKLLQGFWSEKDNLGKHFLAFSRTWQ